jgi:low temperature requirement protein LtrA
VSGPEQLLRRRTGPLGASFLELFFDLAFVLALSQLVSMLLADLSVAGALRTALLLAPVWLAWTTTTWSTDWYDPGARSVRVLLIGATLGTLLMGVALPEALAGRGPLFAGAYVAIHLGRGLLISIGLRGHPLRRRTLRVLWWYSATSVLWLFGAFVPAARVPVWVLALAVDYSGTRLGWPTPHLGRASAEELRLSGGHLSERFQQVFIIALGELILAAGMAYSETGTSLPQTAAFLMTFAAAVLIGLLYVTPAGMHLGPAIDRAYQSRLATTVAYLHLLMIAGVVATAAGGELAITHPTERGTVAAVAVTVAGPALFLAGRVLLSVALHRRFSWPRLGGLLAMFVAAVVAIRLPLLAASAITTAVLFVVAAVDHTGVFSPPRVGQH